MNTPNTTPSPLREVAALFLRLGFTAFGGPAAHIAMMETEVVRKRRWVSHEEFLDLLGATNLIPGPNSTEMAIHLGYLRAGWPGLIVAGLCFILPAMSIVLALAWAYVRYGTLPIAGNLLLGVKAVMIAVVAQALWNLGRKAMRGPLAIALGVLVFGLYRGGQNELVLLFGGAALFVAVRWLQCTRMDPPKKDTRHGGPAVILPFLAQGLPTGVTAGLAPLFFKFLRIGSVLYGSGYVLLAFLRNDFVARTHWLTDRQLLDAVSVGQLTPGPVFTTATFVGYLMAGTPGALVATAGIFLPSFVFVAITGPWVRRLRAWPWTASALDGVNIAALGLMAGVGWDLAREAFVPAGRVSLVAIAIALISVALLIRARVNATWLILGGAVIGILARGV